MEKFVLLLLFACCTSKSTSQEFANCNWPSEWTNDMSVIIRESGGMVPEHWEMTVSGDSATYVYTFHQNTTKVKAKLTKENLDLIASIIREARPEKIKMKEHPVIYDKGSTHVLIYLKKCIVSLGESATESFTDSGEKQFRKIVNVIYNTVMQEIRKQEIDVKLQVECSGSNQFWTQFQIENRGIGILGCPDSVRNKKVSILPGQHSLFYFIFKSNNGKYTGGEKAWRGESLSLPIYSDTTIRFTLKDSIMVVERNK